MVERHAYVLVHSPITGPGTWEPVADELHQRGIPATVPDLIDDGSPPFWRQHARCVVRSIAEDIDPGAPLVLVAHSGAGQLLGVLGPVLRDAGYRVTAEILADAGLPPAGHSRLEQLGDDAPGAADGLREALDEGVPFPAWDDETLRPLVPDERRRQRLRDELRPQPAGYWLEQIPTAVDWPDAPVGVLIFSDGYAGTVDAATQHGWPLRRLEGDNHFLALANAPHVTDELLALTAEIVDTR
ncbi:MAG TPA: hypothetical protein VK923_13335 [Euzebyales bacterium]|nr:hypothetical protein [Euzebyales bacterium]